MFLRFNGTHRSDCFRLLIGDLLDDVIIVAEILALFRVVSPYHPRLVVNGSYPDLIAQSSWAVRT